MSYRKINVDGTIYQYTVGKTTLKVKGMPATKVNHDAENINPITPAKVAEYIRKNVK